MREVKTLPMLIRETEPTRTVEIGCVVVAGPGGDGRTVASFTVSVAALREALPEVEPSAAIGDFFQCLIR